MTTRPCSDCGELFTLDEKKYAVATHDCETGEWFLLPREMPELKDQRRLLRDLFGGGRE
jgi:hypothetical protein